MIEEYLKYLRAEQGASPLTVANYGADLKEWERFMREENANGEFSPMDYTVADLRLWVAELSHRGLAPRSVHRKMSAISSFYRYLLKYRGLKVNPATDLSLAKIPKSLPVFCRPDEINTLLDEPVDLDDFVQVRDRLILLMLYVTGMRSAELLGLLDRNVDTRACELKVHGKRNKDRIIPFGKELSDMIESYRLVRAKNIGADSPLFFVKEDGAPLYRKKLYDIVHNALEQAGVHAERKSPHALRHSFATDMLNSGADISSVSKLLGHASLSSTQIYTHITYRDLKLNYVNAHPRALKKGENYGSKN